MASNPKFLALVAKIEAMPGGWDDIFEAIADGATYRMLGQKFQVSRSFIHRVVVHDPERRKRAEEAYEMRAHAMIDESIEIADNVNVNLPADVQAAKLKIDLRKWLAAVDNARYQRAEAKINLNVTLGQLHLDALKRRSIEAKVTAGPADTHNDMPLVAPPVVDAEFEEDTDEQGIVEAP